jgi:hypothetical protein
VREFLPVTLLNPKNAFAQTMDAIVDLADDLQIKLQRVPIGE